MNPSILLSLCFSLFAYFSWSQSPIQSKIDAAKMAASPQTLNFFEKLDFHKATESEFDGLSSFTLYDIPKAALGSIQDEQPSFIALDLELDQEAISLELVETKLLHPQFKVLNAKDEEIEIPVGKYYRGVIKDQPGSMAAFAFYDDDVVAMIIDQNGNNMIFGKMNDQSDHFILYPESGMAQSNPFHCGNDAQMHLHPERLSSAPSGVAEPCKKVNVYIEVDNIMYNDFNRSMTQVTNYVTGVWNVSSLIYENEDVNLGIQTIKIWDTQDPYRKNGARNLLDDFSSNIENDFDGDIGHILTTSRNNMGGLAWVDVLCGSYNRFNNSNRTAMSNIGTSYRQYPQYSWTVMVVTHEMGHNLGSPHTHNCSWGPNRNEALDNCGDPEGSCGRGPVPTGGGTIMSYCHLTSYGINLTKGFGIEPGDLIRGRVQNASCLGGAFEALVEIDGESTFYEGDSTILKARPIGPQYTYQWYENGFIINGETNSQLVVKSSGDYRCDVNTNCTEETEAVTIEVEPFYVSLNCPYEEGGTGEESAAFDTIYIDTDEETHTLSVPADLHAAIPANAISQSVVMEICVGSFVPARLSDMILFYDGPSGSNLLDKELEEHKTVIFGDRCYEIALGDFDPTGNWTIRASHPRGIRPNSPESYAQITIKQTWELAPMPSDCNLTICEGDTAVLDSGYEDLTYSWSTGASSRTINVFDAGTYAVTVSNGGVERSDDIEVTVIPIHFEIDTTVCANLGFDLGGQVIFDSGMYTDTLVASSGCDSIVSLQLTIEENAFNSSELTYCYGDEIDGITLVKDTVLLQSIPLEGRCDSLNELIITVIEPAEVDIDVTPGCEDIGAMVMASLINDRPDGMYTISWSDGQSGASRSGIKSGTLITTVEDEFGCISVDSVLIENFDSVALDYETVDVQCFGDSTGQIDLNVVQGTPGYVYNWSTGSMEEDLDGLPAGAYEIIVTDENNCEEQLTIDIDQNEEIMVNATITSTSGGNDNGSITLVATGGAGNYSFQWSDGDTTANRTDLAVGEYEVTITDDEGCSKTFTFEVEMSSSLGDIAVVTDYRLFPNPVDDNLNLIMQLERSSDISIEVYDILGQMKESYNLGKQSNVSFDMDVSDYQSGQYLLRILIDDQSGILRVIVQ